MRVVVVALAVAALSGCSGSSGGQASSSGATISGQLSQATVSSAPDAVSRYETNFATTGTKIAVDCGTKGSYSALVDSSTGTFSLSGVPLGVPCSFSFVNATSGVTKCQVQFQDSSNYDLNHKPMSTNTASASSSVSLGSITCDSTGTVAISTSTIANVSTGSNLPASKAFDFTGTWSAAAYDGTVPDGYQTITACSGGNCQGPGVGDPISLVRFHGVKFTPSAGQCTPAINVTCPTSAGTDDATQEGYAMSIWGGDYAHGIGACGANTGFTADEARAYAGLDLDAIPSQLSGHALTYGHYAWSTASGFGTDSGWTQPWMYGGARAQWTQQDCSPVSVPSTSGQPARAGFACFANTQNSGGPSTTYIWNVSLQNNGGCVDSNGAPLLVNNWASVTYGPCTSSASSFNSNMQTNSCTYTGSPVAGAPSQTFTCAFTGGNFIDVSGGTTASSDSAPNFSAPYTMPAGYWNGQPASYIAQNATCAGGTSEASLISTATGGGSAAVKKRAAKELLARYQCYAQAYWQNSNNGAGSTACNRNYNFDWSTDNYANFVLGGDRNRKPQNAFITDRVFYSADGQWAYLTNTDNRYQSIPTPTGSTLCPMAQQTQLKFARVSDNKIIVYFSQSTLMADRSTTCQGAVAAAIAGGGNLSPDPTNLNDLYKQLQTQRLVFYLTR